MAVHERHMTAWWRLNPEYRYLFFDDARAARFVQERANSDEIIAYAALLTGAQKADLFRLLSLKYEGGVYADIDSELRAPLWTAIPQNASAVVGRYWNTEFMAYEPHHPLLVGTLHRITSGVLMQLRKLQRLALEGVDDDRRCRSPHSCVIRVTGPDAYHAGISELAPQLGCASRGRLPAHRDCRHSQHDTMRRLHICSRDMGDKYRTWACNISRHWDCRNSGARRRCSRSHYTRVQNFFNVTALFGNATAAPHPLRKCQNERVCMPPRRNAQNEWVSG